MGERKQRAYQQLRLLFTDPIQHDYVERTVSRASYVTIHRFYVYAERELSRQHVSI